MRFTFSKAGSLITCTLLFSTALLAQNPKPFIGTSQSGIIEPEGPTKAGVSSTIPQKPTQAQINFTHPDLPPLPVGPVRKIPMSPPTEAPGTAQANPTATLSVFKNVQVTPSGANRSSIGEPTAAHHGFTAFYTGNWYAAISKNDGNSWSYINPYTKFPKVDGGFCCDQYAMYVPSRKITVWLLQYGYSATTRNGSYRIAVAKNETNLKNGVFHYYTFNPRNFGLPAGYWLDFPHMAYSKGYLFVTANIFTASRNYNSTVCWRMPLSQLAAGTAVSFRYIRRAGRTWRLTFGATNTMYWWQHRNSSSGYLYRWADASTNFQRYTINIGSWNWGTKGTMIAKDPKNRNWMKRSDSRPLGGWVARGVIGFMWNAKQGGNFPYPYTRVVEIRESNRSIYRQTSIWHPKFAWAYPCAAQNSRGHLGGMICYGGGSYYPSTAAWVVDDLDTKFAPLKNVAVAVGNNSPSSQGWGDYLTAIPHSRYSNSWVGSAMATRNGSGNSNQIPRYVHFGRTRDVNTKPDLRPVTLSTSSSNLFHGSPYTFSTKIENVGLSTAPASTNGFYLSTNSTITRFDLLIRSFTLPSIAQGNFRTYSASVSIPSSAPVGTCWAGVVADRTNAISESNEINNGLGKKVNCIGKPDLIISAASTTASSLPAGGLVKVSYTTKNVGTATSNTSVTGVLLSTNSLITTSDTYLGGATEFTLGKGLSRSHSLFVRIPYATPSSTRYLGVYADVGFNVSELNEGNNGRAISGKPSIAYGGSSRLLEYRGMKYTNYLQRRGPYYLTSARLDASNGGSAPMAIVAPKFKGYWYLLLLSGSSTFKFDAFTNVGLGILNSPILPLWLSKIPSSGINYPSFNLPKSSISTPFTMYVYSFWFDPSFKNIIGFGNNRLYLRIEK